MRILIVRHGDAQDRETFGRGGQPDRLRPLTARGERRMWRAARGLVTEMPSLDVLATSPYTRALRTAESLAKAYNDIALEQIPELEPDAPVEPLRAWLTARASTGSIALVGHSPDLPLLVTHLVCQRATPAIKLKKGGACLVSFSGNLRPGEGVLRWLMDSDQLGRLAR